MMADTPIPMRRVNPLYGWKWLRDGWQLFQYSPPLWLSLMALCFFASMFVLALPVVGIVLFCWLVPGLLAGCLLGCREIEAGNGIEIKHLVAGFRQSALPLISLGSYALVAVMVTLLILVAGWKTQFAEVLALVTAEKLDFAAIEAAMASLTMPLLVGLAVFTLFMMAMWFAPALVMFQRLAPMRALAVSFRASLLNFWPFLAYGLLLMLLDVVVSMIVRLIVSLLAAIGGNVLANMAVVVLVFPVVFTFLALMVGAIYVGYKDIFESSAPTENASDA